jgi:hypothetical protein
LPSDSLESVFNPHKSSHGLSGAGLTRLPLNALTSNQKSNCNARPWSSLGIELGGRESATKIDTFDSYLIVTGHLRRLPYWKAMRYFFHIFHGPKVFPDEDGNRLSSPELAIRQAKILAVELSKAGEFCRSNLVLVLDENGKDIFGCRAA